MSASEINKTRYKSVSVYIVELELLKDSITNESALNQIDKNYTLYSTNKVLVKKITHKLDDNITRQFIKNHNRYDTDFDTVYKVDKIIDVKKSGAKAMGVHYFLTKDAAYHYELLKFTEKYTGFHTIRLKNGSTYKNVNYIQGKLSGNYEEWKNNNKILQCTYKNNILDGEYTTWYDNGSLKSKCVYNNDKKNGLGEEWYQNGAKRKKCYYKNDAFDDTFEMWYDNTEKWIAGEYMNGSRVNTWYEWYKYGPRKTMVDYKTGKYSLWTPRGRVQKDVFLISTGD